MQIDTLVMVIADQNGCKSNQMRTIFEEHELFNVYGGRQQQRPLKFAADELADPWARIRPNTASFFELRFSEATPVRIFASKRINKGMGYLRRSPPDQPASVVDDEL